MKPYSREIKIALITVIAVIVIYAGILFLKGVKLARTDNVYIVKMEDVGGLAVQAPVLSNGMEVGVVKTLVFNNETRHVEVSIELTKGFRVPVGTGATLSKDMLGAPKLKLLPGHASDGYLNQGDTIYGAANVDLMEAAGSLVPTLETLLLRADTLLAALNALVNSPELQQSLNHLEQTTYHLQLTTQQLNGVMRDDLPTLLSRVNAVGGNLEVATSQLANVDIEGMAASANAALGELQLFTNRLNNDQGSLGKLLNDPSMYNHLDSTMLQASLLLEDLRLHPKRYVHFSLFGKKTGN